MSQDLLVQDAFSYKKVDVTWFHLFQALRDLDYEVRDKQFAEALLDIEFSDVPGKAVFYIDNGHSFDNVLFYGNELTLFSMDLMVFCFFQVVTGDFLLAAIITALIAKVN